MPGGEGYAYRIGNCESYLAYLFFCDYLIKRKEFEEDHSSICKKLGYPMTKFRTAELIMYLNGGD